MLDSGGLFNSKKNTRALMENGKLRHNADLALHKAISQFRDAQDVRIWPHHFDSGGLIPLEYDENEKLIRSIGVGFAIPDSMVNEPYFYLSYWSADPNDSLESPTPFKGKGTWKTPQWPGAILPLSDIISAKSADSQQKDVEVFFEEGIKLISG